MNLLVAKLTPHCKRKCGVNLLPLCFTQKIVHHFDANHVLHQALVAQLDLNSVFTLDGSYGVYVNFFKWIGWVSGEKS